jgi:hypothetical protein
VFSEVDNIIFPDSCEVIQIASQHFVYPIFKCGRSSLHESIIEQGWSIVSHEQIRQIKCPVQVFLRDPTQRFYSGLNTYIQHLQQEHINLDLDTVLYFANRYLFLNRHYAPQFFWLINLLRFTGPDLQVRLCNIQDISQLTNQHSHAEVIPMTDQLKRQIENFNWSKLELYIYLDSILLEYIGKTVKVVDIIQHVKKNHRELYNLIFQKTINIIDALPKT